MSIDREPKFEKKEKPEPIVDIETQEGVLEQWEKLGLRSEVEDLVPPGERFSIHSANFESTAKFVEKAEKRFKKFKANNLEEKVREVEDNVRKSILSFAVKELGIDPDKPEIVKTKEVIEEIKGEKKKLIIKYLKTNQENLLLGYDGIDWWLEKKE